MLNQVDLHPFMRHPEIVKICEDNGILLEVCIRYLHIQLILRMKVSKG